MIKFSEKYKILQELENDRFVLFSKILLHEQVSREWLLAQSPWGQNKTDLIVKALYDKELIILSKEESSNKGRKPFIYTVNPQIGYFLGFEMNIPYDRLVLTDFTGQVLTRKEYPGSLGKTNALASLCETIRQFLAESHRIPQDVWAIGGTTHGILDEQTDTLTKIMGQEQETEFHLKTFLEQELSIPVFIKRARAFMCLQEYRFSLLEQAKTFLSVYLGYGVGMGIFINGKHYPGVSGFAGEFGHMPVPDSKKPCYCGNTGCLRAHVSYQGICTDAQIRLEQATQDEMFTKIDPAKLQGPKYEEGVEHLIEMALQNDKLSMNLLYDVGFNVGFALANIVSLFNPELLIIHSNLVRAADLFTSAVLLMIRRHSFKPTIQAVDIEFTSLEPYSVAEGGAIWAMRDLGKALGVEKNISFDS